MSTLKIGDPVLITEPTHPWRGHFGGVISEEETYGLGWKGHRVKLADNHGETYVTRDQVMAHGRVDSIRMTGKRRRKA